MIHLRAIPRGPAAQIFEASHGTWLAILAGVGLTVEELQRLA
jgi:hypothetical protein